MLKTLVNEVLDSLRGIDIAKFHLDPNVNPYTDANYHHTFHSGIVTLYFHFYPKLLSWRDHAKIVLGHIIGLLHSAIQRYGAVEIEVAQCSYLSIHYNWREFGALEMRF